jgi:CheY-like chemotaxis protein
VLDRIYRCEKQSWKTLTCEISQVKKQRTLLTDPDFQRLQFPAQNRYRPQYSYAIVRGRSDARESGARGFENDLTLFTMKQTTTLTTSDDPLPDSFGKRILIIDDVVLVGLSVSTQLKRAGFSNVQFESEPLKAMEVVSRFKPDMILLDILMPELSGLELLQQIREIQEYDHIIVLMLSAAGRDEQYKSLELGALGFIQKPTTADNLVRTVTSKFALARRIGLQ